jgi:K+-sensing histidine kinase KdpD
MLQMAINNLIDNAIKYSTKDSVVTVLLRKANDRIELEVKDEGKGIETSEKKKIFDKFYRVGNNATKQARGTGLGLYVTKKIAADHDASIFVTDNKPAGTCFKIVFAGAGQL